MDNNSTLELVRIIDVRSPKLRRETLALPSAEKRPLRNAPGNSFMNGRSCSNGNLRKSPRGRQEYLDSQYTLPKSCVIISLFVFRTRTWPTARLKASAKSR